MGQDDLLFHHQACYNPSEFKKDGEGGVHLMLIEEGVGDGGASE